MNDTIHAFNEPFHGFFFNLKHGPVSQTPSTPMEKTTVGIALRVDSDLLKTNEDILAFQKKKKNSGSVYLPVRQASRLMFVVDLVA